MMEFCVACLGVPFVVAVVLWITDRIAYYFAKRKGGDKH